MFRRLALASAATAVLAVVALGPSGPQPAVFVPPSSTAAATFAGALGSAEQLGASVALSADGQVALIGAPAAAGGGAAYLYVESGGTWPSTPTATFTGQPGSQGEIGTAVALSANGEVALVGAPGGGSAPSNDGAAYLYVEAAGTWPSTPTATFAGAPGSSGKLGSAVALSADGTVALVGAPVASYGAAYVYAGIWGELVPHAGCHVHRAPHHRRRWRVRFRRGAFCRRAGSARGSARCWHLLRRRRLPVQRVGCHLALVPHGFLPRSSRRRCGGRQLGRPICERAGRALGCTGGRPRSRTGWPLSTPSRVGPGLRRRLPASSGQRHRVPGSANRSLCRLTGRSRCLVRRSGATERLTCYTESGGTWSTVAAATFTGPAGSPDDLGDEVALSGNGQTAVLGDAPFTGADAIDGAAYLFSAPAGSEQALQTIVFTSADPSPARSGATYNLVATSTSGLPVAFSVDAASTPGACSLSGTALQFTGGGHLPG